MNHSKIELQKDVTHGTWDYPFEVHQTSLSDGLYLYPHVHNEIEITCITRGQGIFCVNGQDYSVTEGDIIFVSPNSIHLASSTDSNPAEFFSIVFSPLYFSETSRIYSKYFSPIIDHTVSIQNLIDHNCVYYSEILRNMMAINKLYFEVNTELLCQSKLLELWHSLLKCKVQKNCLPEWNIRNILIKESIDYIHAHYAEPISVHKLAGITNMSEGHFSRIFKEYMKITPIDYLIQIRIQVAIKLLANINLSISEISLECGFNDFSYFGQKFKKITGYSPREYRKNLLMSKNN